MNEDPFQFFIQVKVEVAIDGLNYFAILKQFICVSRAQISAETKQIR